MILAVYGAATFMQSMLLLSPSYRRLYEGLPFYVPESIKAALAVAVCVAAATSLYGRGDHFRLRHGALRGVAFGFAAASPMLIGLWFTRTIAVPDVTATIFLAAIFPFTEELIARGFAFGLLHSRERWPLWAAVTAVAAVTGLSHIEKGQTAIQILGLFAVTGLGGLVFCWLLARWNSLWFPFAFHLFLNFWWNVFSVATTALGGWFPFVLQLACVAAAVGITFRLTPNPRRVTPLGPMTDGDGGGAMLRVALAPR
jgi:membrane protease YdiL (CAAX protease family)